MAAENAAQSEKNLLQILIEKIICGAEKSLGCSTDYLRTIARLSPRAFLYLGMSTPLAGYRKKAPPEAYHVARIVAVALERCAASLEIEARIAHKAGVCPLVIEAARQGREENLSEVGNLARDWTLATIENRDGVETLRQKLIEAWGEAAAMEIALGVASARTFPLIRRGLGESEKSCVGS